MKKSYLIFSIIFSIFISGFFASNSLLAQGSKSSYDIKIFPQDQVLNGPLGELTAFYLLIPGLKIEDPTYIDVHYSSSQLIVQDISYMTMHINGNPVSSMYIGGRAPDSAVWRVEIPARFFRTGFNDLKIATLQRTTADPCTDLYNNANWVRILANTTLHVSLFNADPSAISSYPHPYLDFFTNTPVNSDFVLAPDFTAEDAADVMRIASDWGAKLPFKNMNINVVLKSNEPNLRNRIYIGELSKFPEIKPTVSGNPSDGIVYKQMVDEGQITNLYLTGADKTAVRKSVTAMLNPNDVLQMEGQQAYVEKVDTTGGKQTSFLPREGLFTLQDLGLPRISLDGIFLQKYKLSITRPVRISPSLDSYLRLYFYHSENLDRKQSLLTVLVNGFPVGSAELSPENSKGGELLVKVPESELEKPIWNLEFSAYHFLGSTEYVDCTFNYDAAAWTVIEGRTEINLSLSESDVTPSLLNFPSIVTGDAEALKEIYFWLPAKPTESQLKLAAVIAAKAGQGIKNSIDFKVIMADELDNTAKSNASVIFAIGYPQERKKWESLKDVLMMYPNQNGGYTVNPKLSTIRDNIQKESVIEAVQSPWNKKGIIYTIIPSDNEGANSLASFLADPQKSSKMEGHISMFMKNGEVVPFSITEPISLVKTFMNPLKNIPLRYLIVGVILVAILVYIVIRLFKRKKTKTA